LAEIEVKITGEETKNQTEALKAQLKLHCRTAVCFAGIRERVCAET
jgi:hypothetical protein